MAGLSMAICQGLPVESACMAASEQSALWQVKPYDSGFKQSNLC